MVLSGDRHVIFVDESHKHAAENVASVKKLDVISLVTRDVQGNGTYELKMIC